MRMGALIVLPMFFACIEGGHSSAQPKPPEVAKIKPERARAMKAAIADIEAGTLRQTLVYPFAPPAFIGQYGDLARKEYGIEIHLTRDLIDDGNGYNDVMRVEIEHRFGHGVLTKLIERAEAEYLKNKKE
jgi:hypothetical protein